MNGHIRSHYNRRTTRGSKSATTDAMGCLITESTVAKLGIASGDQETFIDQIQQQGKEHQLIQNRQADKEISQITNNIVDL